MKVLVTASYGRIAHRLIPMLTKSGVQVRAVDPDPAHVEELKALGASEVILGDFRRDEIIDQEVQDVDKIFLILPDMVEGMVGMAERLIKAAEHANVKHFVFCSCLNTVMELLQHWEKYQVEDLLMGSQIPYTILKPSSYMEMHFPSGPGSVFETGVMNSFIYQDELDNMISLEDIAAAGAKVLLSDEEYYYASFDLCGEVNEPMKACLARLAKAIGKKPVINMIPTPRTNDVHTNDQLGRMAAYHSNHPFAGNPFDFNHLMGRPAKSFDQYMNETLAKMN
ncbi:SDR family oxidoreductase [Oenococcus oeni]